MASSASRDPVRWRVVWVWVWDSPGLRKQGGAGGFQFVERTERLGSGFGRAVVVGIDHIAAEGIDVFLPLGIDVRPRRAGGFCEGWITHQGERAGVRLPASGDALGAFRRDADLAALRAIAFEEEDGFAELDAVVRDLAEVSGVGDRAECRIRRRV